MKKNLKIRADGNTEIGLGHLVRCIALAEMLQEFFDITFFSKTFPEGILETIRSKGFSYTKLEVEDEFISFLSGEEIVVLDHYELGSEYQRKVKESGCKLVCIDDLKKNVFYADLIINFSPEVSKDDYLAQRYTSYALGPEFSLLRPGFLEAAQKDRKIEKIENILICFGGSDFKNITQKVLAVTAKFSEFNEINVVVGSAYRHLDALSQSTIFS